MLSASVFILILVFMFQNLNVPVTAHFFTFSFDSSLGMIVGVATLLFAVSIGMKKSSNRSSLFNTNAPTKQSSRNPLFDEADTETDRAKVTLTDAGSNKIATIKVIRRYKGTGLKETKELVEMAPVVIYDDLGRGRATHIVEELNACGAKATLELL